MTYDHPKPLATYASDQSWRQSVIRRRAALEPWESAALVLGRLGAERAEEHYSEVLSVWMQPENRRFYEQARELVRAQCPA